ncbi:MAG: ribokinase [Sphingobacteriales bacterium]|nr:ribokinase [Sphingobacteriales bacterium]MBI3719229.1 ribokinase [Sphingobacteriales bacterium]
MKKKRIVIIGSSNTDMVIKTNRLPAPGETVIGGSFFLNAGGKGANQAVAASRLGGNILFIAKVGNDIFGEQAIDFLKKEKLNTSFILKDKKSPSGIALINVDDKGENCIAVASGANASLLPSDIKKFRSQIETAALLLMQLETPVETILYAAAAAAKKNVVTILNPAPACVLPNELYQYISIITPNETEATLLTGINVHNDETARQACIALNKKGVATVIITMGAKGALVYHNNTFFRVSAPKVKAIDTTAAGDVFNAALTVALSEDKPMKEAVQLACHAAAVSVTRLGAQSSAPYRKEVKM